ncbi:CHC2 zinc finger domain-containing protein [Priestia aryabhattai]|uniref:CHC2 zinc finger domain-containing protein n=1 Tax=Priestia aryabhattai TaxID=412384 RepID=UPI003D2E44B7
MSDVIEVIKQSYKIENILEQFIGIDLSNVRKKNKSYNICCPFHQDNHPSFTVWEETNYWKCWAGCGGGDQINLVAKALNLKNHEAIKLLNNQLNLKKTQVEYMKSGVEELLRDKELIKKFNDRIRETFSNLIALRVKTKKQIQEVMEAEDLESEYVINLHHLVPKLEGWLESLESENYAVQYHTLLDIQNFFKKGLNSWIKTK